MSNQQQLKTIDLTEMQALLIENFALKEQMLQQEKHNLGERLMKELLIQGQIVHMDANKRKLQYIPIGGDNGRNERPQANQAISKDEKSDGVNSANS